MFNKEMSESRSITKRLSGTNASLKSLDVTVGSMDDRSNTESIGMEWNQEKSRAWDPWLHGDFNLPRVELPNEVNFIGGLGPNVGHARSAVHIQRPTTVQKVYSMRTRNQPVFTFCEDPRKANNVVPKKEKIDYRNLKRIRKSVERVRLAQNVETPPPSDFSEDPTEVNLPLVFSLKIYVLWLLDFRCGEPVVSGLPGIGS